MGKKRPSKRLSDAEIAEIMQILDEYLDYLKSMGENQPKNSKLYNAYNYINRNRNRKDKPYPGKIVDMLLDIEDIKERIQQKYIDGRLHELKKFLETNNRLPLQRDEEKSLGYFFQNFPRQRSTDEQKKSYHDMIESLHDRQLDCLLEYKKVHNQSAISPREKEYRDMLTHINHWHCKKRLTKEQEEKYKELNYQPVIHESREYRTERLIKELEEFVGKYRRMPRRESEEKSEKNLAINIKRYMKKDKHIIFKFDDEQRRRVEAVISKDGRKRGGVSYPELMHAIAIEKLLDGEYHSLHKNKVFYGVNCDLFMRINEKAYAFFYDGCKYHKEIIDKDRCDTEQLLDAGVTVFRVRESGLEKLGIENPLYHEFSSKKNRGSFQENISRILNVIRPGSYSDRIKENWESVCDEAKSMTSNMITEGENVTAYIRSAYKNRRIPSKRKEAGSEEKKIYGRMQSLKNRAGLSKLGTLMKYCTDVFFTKNERRYIEDNLKKMGMNGNTLKEIKNFLREKI